MKVIQKKDCTVLRLTENECAIYHGVVDGQRAVGVIGGNDISDMQMIDAAMRGVALMMVNDPEFVPMMAKLYADHVVSQPVGTA
jgi:hypothetical protein